MREIKFRVWVKQHKLLLRISELRLSTAEVETELKGNHPFVFDLEDVALMQYTGLKDKNSKEIYEGDIVNFPMFDSGGHLACYCKGEVVWNQEHLTYEIGQRIGTAQYAKPDRKCEIIGNIYKNKELLI